MAETGRAGWMGRMVLLAALGFASAPALAEDLTARVVNETHTTTCAEEDNVSLNLVGPGITRLRVEALHPAYMPTVTADSYEPDFSGCNFSPESHPTDPAHKFTPRRVVLYSDDSLEIIGNTYETFWRPDVVPLSIEGRSEPGLHLIQVYRKTGDHKDQFLVLYPPDGYWRAKPLPVPHLGYGVYGSSFLLGPVEQAGRPVVRISGIEIVPKPLSFRLRFAGGGGADVAVSEVSNARIALDVQFERPTNAEQPFGVIRSMFVRPEQADMSEISWRDAGGTAHIDPLDRFRVAEVRDVRFARSVLSTHNTSAPDMWFGAFGN
ncbi:hypothetical protein ACRC7T_09935 [Segnochrobactraceae bacterium EtOH-i3]